MRRDWPTTVRAALQDSRVLAGISQVAASWMAAHIDASRGRGRGGKIVEYAPLKRVSGRYWTKKAPKNAVVLKTRKRYSTKFKWVKGALADEDMVLVEETKMHVESQVEQVSYRFGGQPLRDTGDLYRSLGATASSGANSIKLTMQGNGYGRLHDRGFKTNGPVHFIPLTKKGRRGHAVGASPDAEGLIRGKDYVLRGSKKNPKGVTVPARPFILPLPDDLRDLGRSIYRGLRAVLKG